MPSPIVAKSSGVGVRPPVPFLTAITPPVIWPGTPESVGTATFVVFAASLPRMIVVGAASLEKTLSGSCVVVPLRASDRFEARKRPVPGSIVTGPVPRVPGASARMLPNCRTVPPS